jgi:hypothetical protein
VGVVGGLWIKNVEHKAISQWSRAYSILLGGLLLAKDGFDSWGCWSYFLSKLQYSENSFRVMQGNQIENCFKGDKTSYHH